MGTIEPFLEQESFQLIIDVFYNIVINGQTDNDFADYEQ